MSKEKIIWETFESCDGERILKEHAYKNRVINHWAGEYIGATALCNKKSGASIDGESYMLSQEIGGLEIPRMVNTCKKCLKIWEKSKINHERK